MEHKKIKSGILLFVATILLLANLLAVPTALAKEGDPPAADTPAADPGAGGKCDLTCPDLNPDPTNAAGQAKVKSKVVTINEEEIGGDEGSIGDMCVLYCIRNTECTKAGDNKGCKSKFTASCEGTTAPDADPYKACQRVQVLYGPTGSALLYGYIGLIYRYAAGIIGIICVLYLVYGGIRITTAGDNTGAIDEAKQKIIQSIAGLVLLFLSAVILYTINPNFFTTV